MRTVAGIFNSRAEAERAAVNLRAAGIRDERITFLAPGTSESELDAAVPTTETEQPGMGKALGGTVGGALGIAGGMHLGAAIASFLVPGVGPVIAAGLVGAALLGAGGAATGVAAGGALEENIAEGLPHDELYVYEDALRRGHSVVIAVTEDEPQETAARSVLETGGAESIDAARENWWIGLRDAEEERYTGEGGDFKTHESLYRRGFEAALSAKARGRTYEEMISGYLPERHQDVYSHAAFKAGYDRGHNHYNSLRGIESH